MGQMTSSADNSANWSAADRHGDVLEDFLDRAAIEGERAATRLRLLLCSLGLVYEVSLDWSTTLPAGFLPDWIRILTYVVGIAYSVFVLRYIVGKNRAEGILRTSVVLDPILIVGLIVPAIIEFDVLPHAGVVRDVALYAFLLTAISSGVRLSLGAAKIGIAATCIAFVFVLTLDEIVWAGRLPYGLRTTVWPAIMVLGSSVFGWDLVKRMRHLVIEGANAMLFAERAKSRLRSYVSEGVAEDAMRVSQISMSGKRQTYHSTPGSERS